MNSKDAVLNLQLTLVYVSIQVEWMWWVDADAVFTDMSLEPPFADLKDHNLLLFREDRKDMTGLHTGNYLIRNCQWSLDLIQAWGSASAKPADYNESLTTAAWDLAAEEKAKITFDARQSALVTSRLFSQKGDHAGDKVKETENWGSVAPHLEFLQVKQQQKQQEHVVPLVTHFAGCMPCSTGPPDQVWLPSATQLQPQRPSELEGVCLQQLDRTFDFADNQVRYSITAPSRVQTSRHTFLFYSFLYSNFPSTT